MELTIFIIETFASALVIPVTVMVVRNLFTTTTEQE